MPSPGSQGRIRIGYHHFSVWDRCFQTQFWVYRGQGSYRVERWQRSANRWEVHSSTPTVCGTPGFDECRNLDVICVSLPTAQHVPRRKRHFGESLAEGFPGGSPRRLLPTSFAPSTGSQLLAVRIPDCTRELRTGRSPQKFIWVTDITATAVADVMQLIGYRPPICPLRAPRFCRPASSLRPDRGYRNSWSVSGAYASEISIRICNQRGI